MNSEKNVRNWGIGVLGMAGAAAVGYGLYKLWKKYYHRLDIDLEPAETSSHPHPYFDPHKHHAEETVFPKNQAMAHRPHVGNSPGERNQIGGRTSGKRARF